MLKRIGLAFAVTAFATPAKAEPISAIISLVTAIGSAISGAVTAVGTAVFGAGLWGSISAFLASPFGSLLLGVGVSLISTLFSPKQRKSQQSPTTEAGKVNVRITEPERWLCAGLVRQGGGILFAEHDANGYLWIIIVHSDSIISDFQYYFLDDIDVEIDENNLVISNQFCVDPDYNSYNGTGTKVPHFTVWTNTHSETDPTPPAFTALATAFPSLWTADHKLVGTTYSVLRCFAVPFEHRYKIFKWRGPCGLGEPAVSVFGNWSNIYDPRDVTQDIDDRSTWKPTRNPILIWAWFRTHKYGRGKTMSSINWEKVAEQADICDETVVGIAGSQPRYECGISIPESKDRGVAEQEILMSCDGQLVFDDDGKCWPRAGYYYAPELTLTRNRDIVGMESVEAQTGESETQGVIVRYIDPEAKYSAQPSAAWLNPRYYVEGQTPKFMQIDILACQNHNQAMRLAKAHGERSQSSQKILPTVGLRGLQARKERIVDIQYDNTFNGDFQIATSVEVDELGIFCGFGAVPVTEDSWTLLPGEERPKPVIVTTETDYVVSLPSDVVVVFQNNRLEATYTPSSRKDWRYRFQYSLNGIEWSDMVVDNQNNFAYSGVVAANADYQIQWWTIATSGRVSVKSTPVVVNTSPLILTGTPVLIGTDGVPYTSWTVGVTGGSGVYTFEDVGATLPPGITINPATGEVSGTPTDAGSYTDITLKVSDSIGNFKLFPTFTINISP